MFYKIYPYNNLNRVKCITGPPYEKHVQKHCDSSKYGDYNTLTLAQSACNSDKNCRGIYDSGCDNSGTFVLCPISNDLETTTITNISCVFEKIGKCNGRAFEKFYPKGNANELRCYWETWFLLFLIVRVIRTKSDGAYNSPHCGGLLSSCRENDATRLKCADALCKAQGYAVGTFVEASNNFCNSHFEYTNYFTAPYHAYALDGHDVYYGNYSNVAIITADCTPSGEHIMTLPMFWWKCLWTNMLPNH